MRSKNALFNVISSIILQFIVIIYGFIVPKLIISTFGSEVYGLTTSISQFLGYIVLLEAGIGPVIKSSLYKPIVNKSKKDINNILYASNKFFKKMSLIFLIYIVLLMFCYPLVINSSFDYFFTFSLIFIIAISSFAEYYFGIVYRLFLQANQKNYVITLTQIVLYIINAILVFVLIKFNCNIHILKLTTGLIFVIKPIVQNIYVRRKFNIDIKSADKDYKLKNKWDGLVQHIAYVIHSNTDIAVITLFCNLFEVSVYSVYMLVVRSIKNVIQAISNSIDSLFGNMIANGEKSNLNKKFSMYEFLFFTIVSILFSSTLMLITPFIKIYTLNIDDVNYIRPYFGFLLVIGEMIWAFRQPYNCIILSAGHFKETKLGAIIEALINIILSIILVIKFGVIGVAIGTIVAMLVRTIEFIYHTNKYILNRSCLLSFSKIILQICLIIIICLLSNYFDLMNISSYFDWIKKAIIVFSISCVVVIPINTLLFNKDFREFIGVIKKMKKRI